MAVTMRISLFRHRRTSSNKELAMIKVEKDNLASFSCAEAMTEEESGSDSVVRKKLLLRQHVLERGSFQRRHMKQSGIFGKILSIERRLFHFISGER